MDFLLSAEELYHKLGQVVIIDTRFELLHPTKGKALYQKSHIPGAQYFDLNEDLASPIRKHGGKHPLPDSAAFLAKLGEAGIDQDTTIVIYDQGNAMFAARLHWLLDYYGHKRKYILDGGFTAWEKAGYATTDSIVIPTPKSYHAEAKQDMIVNIEQVKERQASRDSTLIDARSWERYLGKTEPYYEKAGHIPGAKSFDWQPLLTEQGKWKTKKEIRDYFSELKPGGEIVVSCGSGVSACMNILALRALGYTNVKLYPGSFSDWISYPENKVETKAE